MFQSWWGVFLLTMHYVQVGIYSKDTYIKAYKKLCMLLLKRQCLKQTKNKKQQKLLKKLNLNSYTVIFLSFYWFKNYGCVFKHLKKLLLFTYFLLHTISKIRNRTFVHWPNESQRSILYFESRTTLIMLIAPNKVEQGLKNSCGNGN